jgi:hypothetical protein
MMSTAGCVKVKVSDSSLMPSANKMTASGLAPSTEDVTPTPCVSRASSGRIGRLPGSNDAAMMLVPVNQYGVPGLMKSQTRALSAS